MGDLNHTVTLNNAHPNRIYEIVADLGALNLVRGVDFTFSYYPAWYSLDNARERYVEFNFDNAETATWFRLKYC